MGFFNAHFDRPGPGIEKNAPEKKGLARFFDIYIRAFWELIKLNFIFILFCIPIVTIGPACAGMSRVTMLMVRERPFFIFSDFWEAFRKEFKQSFFTGLLTALLTAALAVGMVFYMTSVAENKMLYLAWFILIITGFMLCLSSIYIYPMIVTVALPLKLVYKNSLLLGIVCLKHSLPALLVIAVLTAAMVLLLPFTVPVVLTLFFSLVSFICSFAAWPGIQKYVANGGTQKNEEPERAGKKAE